MISTTSIPKSLFTVGAISKSLSSTASMQKSFYSVASTLFVPGVAHSFDSWLWASGDYLKWAGDIHMGVEHV